MAFVEAENLDLVIQAHCANGPDSRTSLTGSRTNHDLRPSLIVLNYYARRFVLRTDYRAAILRENGNGSTSCCFLPSPASP